MTDSLLLTAARVQTFAEHALLTNASGFFFVRNHQLFLVTSRHVVHDAPTNHMPTRLEIELHTDAHNLVAATQCSIPLYHNGQPLWRQARDSSGDVDVAAIEIDAAILPQGAVYRAFTPSDVLTDYASVAAGDSVLIVGFPLGFHDTFHHMPVVRSAVIASAFGLRFQGQGYFLTDARTHRGTSGAPVVMRKRHVPHDDPLPWLLLGVHSASFDVGTRDERIDEALGLNSAWYADILLTLTA